jgi:hypothetical protein
MLVLHSCPSGVKVFQQEPLVLDLDAWPTGSSPPRSAPSRRSTSGEAIPPRITPTRDQSAAEALRARRSRVRQCAGDGRTEAGAGCGGAKCWPFDRPGSVGHETGHEARTAPHYSQVDRGRTSRMRLRAVRDERRVGSDAQLSISRARGHAPATRLSHESRAPGRTDGRARARRCRSRPGSKARRVLRGDSTPRSTSCREVARGDREQGTEERTSLLFPFPDLSSRFPDQLPLEGQRNPQRSRRIR